MRYYTRKTLPVLALLLAAPSVFAQFGNSGFTPLDRWAAAVLAGNQPAIEQFYIKGDPRASAQTPQGKTPDLSGEETAYWSAMRSRGLVSITPKILEQDEPQPDVKQLSVRIEMTMRSGAQTQKMLVIATQVWIKKGGDWFIGTAQRFDMVPLPVITLPQPSVPNPHLYPDPDEAKAEINAALAKAKTDHKRVLVVFGANWCYDCHVLDATLKSKDVASLVAANYHVVHVNVGHGDQNGDLAERYQVPLKKGIPSLAVLDSSGKLITSQKQGEFESAAKIGMTDVLGFLNRWKPA